VRDGDRRRNRKKRKVCEVREEDDDDVGRQKWVWGSKKINCSICSSGPSQR
jgi:hypothetical protein